MPILRGYFDDSGSHSTSQAYVLAGFLSSDSHWSEFSAAWSQALLKDPPIDYFKMSEANRLDGQFATWTPSLRDQRVLELAEIIEPYAVARISSVVMQADFNAHIKGASHWDELDNPYFMLFYQCIFLTITFIRELEKRTTFDSRDVTIEFVFDEQGIIGRKALSWWEVLRQALDTQSVQLLVSPPEFQSDRAAIPLQAADLYSWHVRNMFEGGRESIGTKAVIETLRKVPPYGGHLTGGQLLQSRPELVELSKRYSRSPG